MSNEPQNDWSSPEEWAAHFSALYPDEASLLRRIVAQIQRDLETGCWVWTGYMLGASKAKGKAGSPSAWIRGKQAYLRPYFYQLDYSRDLKENGMNVVCTCGKACCLNPAHMALVTHSQRSKRVAENYWRAPIFEPTNLHQQTADRGISNKYSAIDRYYKRTEDGCLRWQKSLLRNGYASVRSKGLTRVAHHIMWERHHGLVPNGYRLTNICGHRDCGEITHWKLARTYEYKRRPDRDIPIEQRFQNKIRPDSKNGCDLWIGGKNAQGHGIFAGENGRQTTARRFAYERTHGKGSIPPGFNVICTCNRTDDEYCVKHLALAPKGTKKSPRAENGRFVPRRKCLS